MLEKEEGEGGRNRGQESILKKLYQPMKKKKIDVEDKIGNCFFMKASKLLVIYRKPISPYITEKVSVLSLRLNKT